MQPQTYMQGRPAWEGFMKGHGVANMLHDGLYKCEAFKEAHNVTCCTQIRSSWTTDWTSST